MQVNNILIVSVVFLFYVFIFHDLVTAINNLSPAIPLYTIFKIIPYVLGTIILYLMIYFGFQGDSN